MSETSATSRGSTLIWMDQKCDRLPFISTITNIVDIVEKIFLNCFFSDNSIQENRYFSHIEDKNIFRCLALLVPFFGNIGVGIYDCVQGNDNDNDKAVVADLGIERFKNLIAEKANQSEIDSAWLALKDCFADKGSKIQKQKIQEVATLRCSQYRGYLRLRDFFRYENALLEEAIHYYVASFPMKKRNAPEGPIFEQLLPKLKERVKGKDENDYHFIELREIIKKVEPMLVKRQIVLPATNYDQHPLNLAIKNFKYSINSKANQSKINSAWLALKDRFADKGSKIQKQQIQEVTTLRCEQYQKYMNLLEFIRDEPELLKEAKNYYIESFTIQDQPTVKGAIKDWAFERLLPKLKERVKGKDENDYHFIELREIIKKVEPMLAKRRANST